MIELLNHCAPVWAEYFGLALIQNTVFLALIFVVLHRLRNGPASVKQILATLGLIKLLLPPFMPVSFGMVAPVGAPSLTEAAASVVLLRPASLTAADPTAPAGPELTLLGALLVVWAVVALVILAGSLVATLRLALVLRDSIPVSDSETRDLLRFSGITVRRSGGIGMPLTLGVLPRTIFVPPLWDDWTPECRRRVLQHELAHIRRFDGLIQMLQIWVRALYFFHPLVRILDRRLGEYREMACDDASAGFGRDSRIAYSRCLVEIAESVSRNPVLYEPASTLLGRKRELLNRVRYQTEGNFKMSKTKRSAVLVAMVLLALPLSLYVSDSVSESPATGVAQAATAGSKEGPQTITLAVEGGDIQIASKEVAERLAQEMAKVELDVGEDAVVNILCEDQATMGVLFAVQDMLIERELYRVTYSRGKGEGLSLFLPSRDLQKKMAGIAAENLAVLHLTKSGGVLLDGAAPPEKKLFALLKKRVEANDNLVVSITADEDARFGQFLSALGQAKQAGAQRIAVGNPAK